MECGEHDGRCAGMARGASGVVLQLHGGRGGVPVSGGARLPGGAVRAAGGPRRAPAPRAAAPDAPFMNDMDEISYWIYTKRAPCLMNYDKHVRKQSEEAQCSNAAPEDPPLPRRKKKKRKLSLLDEDSVSTDKPQNIFFEVPPGQNNSALKTQKTESVGSDVDFNITVATVTQKNKKPRLKKNCREKLHKKAKLVTSTPKAPVTLRRSLRRTRQVRDSSQLDRSFEMYEASVVSNGHFKTVKADNTVNKTTQMFAAEDCDASPHHKKNSILKTQKSKTAVQPNGQLEDMSDVSGFTASYIRSTKVQSGKTPKKLRCKPSRNLGPVKETHASSTRDSLTGGKLAMCLNKSTNTGIPPSNMLNCSTDSSQNVINLVTTRSQDKSGKADKSTSLLKFVDASCDNKDGQEQVDSKQKNRSNLNISFQSQSSSTSRYPKRCKNDREAGKAREVSARVRSRRSRGHQCDEESPADSSSALLAVTKCPQTAEAPRRSRPPRAAARASRERSGFAACFSDSDDSAPLLHRKYFCN